MAGIRRTPEQKALAKELAGHSHFPNLWIHAMNMEEISYIYDLIDKEGFDTECIGREIIDIEADGHSRITLIFRKPEPFLNENYKKWERIKTAVQLRRKELAEKLRKENEMIELRIERDEFDSCNFCHESINGDMNDDIIAKDIKLINGELLMQASIFVTDRGGLELYLDGPSGCKLDKRVVKINYCPMCGRKLKED